MLLLLGWQDPASMVVEATQSAKLPPADSIFGSTPAMRDVRFRVEQAQAEGSPLFIEGENGTGKEVVARHFHVHSRRAEGAFVRVNCGAIPARLLEEEMFGSVDASGKRQDRSHATSMGMAAGGTLFLDEIADLDLRLQRRLVDVLQTSSPGIEGTGHARVVCASRLELDKALGSGRILGSLARAFGDRVRLLPLRERKEDIPKLCAYLVDKFARSFGRPAPSLSPYVLEAFQQWSWPGNIRELENWVARIVIFGTEEAIGMEFMSQLDVTPKERRHRAVYGNSDRQRRSSRRI